MSAFVCDMTKYLLFLTEKKTFDILIAISFFSFSLLSNINLIYGIAVTVWFNFIKFSTFDVTLVVGYKWDYKTERIVDIQSNERR